MHNNQDLPWNGPSGPLPLAIGVAGHRDIPPDKKVQEGLESAVRNIFIHLRKVYPHTPLLLLTSLAEGADRLVARVALENEFKDENGKTIPSKIELIVPLPMPAEEYARTFPSPESVAEFHELLKRSKRPPFVMPRVPQDPDPTRFAQADLQYALVGSFIARHSQLLIALWNGVDSTKIGGTGYTVQFNLKGEFEDNELQILMDKLPEPFQPRLSPLHPPESGPVYRIACPRAGSPEIIGKPFQLEKRYHRTFDGREGEAATYYGKIYRLMDEFNRDSIQLRGNPSESSKLIPDDLEQTLSQDLKILQDHYSAADRLAQSFQKKTDFTLLTLCILAFLAALFLEIYTHVLDLSKIPWPLGVYHLILSVVVVLYLRARHLNYQNKYQDYRALAEGLRVQFFWRLAGLSHSAADHYLRKQSSELEWIPNAVRNWGILCDPQPDANWDLVKSKWVLDQHDYFTDRLWKSRKTSFLLHSAANYNFLVASFLLLSVFALEWSHHIEIHTGTGIALLLVGSAIVLCFSYISVRQIAHERSDSMEELHTMKVEARQKLKRMNEYKSLYWQRIKILLGGLLGIAAIAAALYFSNKLLGFQEGGHLMHGLIILAVILLAVLGGLLHFYINKKAIAEHVKQYKRMILIFTNARDHFDVLGEQGIIELGREALAENGDWVLLHRERPLEVPRH